MVAAWEFSRVHSLRGHSLLEGISCKGVYKNFRLLSGLPSIPCSKENTDEWLKSNVLKIHNSLDQKYSAFTSFRQVYQMLNILQPLNFVLFTHAFVASSFSVIDFFLAFKKSIYTKYHCLLSQKKILPRLTLFVHPN